MPDEERKLTLITEVDEKRIQRSRQRVQELAKAYKNLDVAIDRHAGAQYRGIAIEDNFGSKQRESIKALRERFSALREQVGGLERLEQAQKEANKETEKAVSLNQQVRASSQELIQAKFAASRLGGALTGLGLPEVGGAVSGAGNLASLAAQLPRLTSAAQGAPAAIAKTASALLGMEVSFGAVVAAAAPVLVAFAAVSVAYKKFQTDLETAKKSLDAARDAQRTYFEAIAEGTTESLQRTLEEAQQRQQVVQAQLEAQRAAQAQLTDFQRLIAGGNIRKGIRELEAEANAATYEIDALNNALGSAEVAARDAAEAERQRAEELVQSVERVAQIEQERLNLIEEGSSQQFEDRIQQIERERATIERQIAELSQFDQESEVYAERIQELRLQLGELNSEQERLADGTYRLIRAREREEEALKNLETLTQAAADYNSDIADIEAKIADTRSESLRKLDMQLAEAERGIAVDLLRADEKAARQLQQKIADVEAEGRDKEIELRNEANDKLVDLEKKAAKERQRILKDYSRAAGNAIRDRDAVALTAAQEARDDQLATAQDQYDESVAQEKAALKERLDEARKSNRDRINDLRTSYQRERQERLIAANQRLQDLRREAEIRRAETIRALDIQLQQELQKRNEAFAKQLQQLGAHNINLANINQAGLNQLAEQLKSFYSNAQIVNTSAKHAIGGFTSGGKKSYQSGGVIPQTGLYLMHGGEGVIPSRDMSDALRGLLLGGSRAGAGGRAGGMQLTIAPGAFTINSRATTSQGMLRDVEREFPRMLLGVLKGLSN